MDHRAAFNRRLLFYTLYLAYISAGIISILPGPALSLLAMHTSVPLDVAGWIFTTSASGFAIGVMIAGLLTAVLRPKHLLMIGMSLMASTGLITPLAYFFPSLLAVQFAMGVGFGFLDVSINITVALAFPDTLSETLNNLHSSYGVGALVAPLLLSLALEVTHQALWAFLVGSVAGLACICLLARQYVPTTTKQVEKQPQQGVSRSRSVFGQTLLWFMALQFFLYIAAEVGFSSWIVTAVSQSAAITIVLAAPVATVFWLGLTLGRLISAQVLKRALLSENMLLSLCFIGGSTSGLLVAIFPGQLAVSFGASGLAGLFFGPVFPGLMAIASRRFAHALGAVSSVLLISSGIAGMIVPVLMGILIPSFGINWVMAIPALSCLLITVPFSLATRRQRRPLHSQDDGHTMKEDAPLQQSERESPCDSPRG